MQNQIFYSISEYEYQRYMQQSSWEIDSLAIEMNTYYSPYYDGDTMLYIPYRVGYQITKKRNPMFQIQFAMDLCLQTRHQDGYVREEALRILFYDGYIKTYIFVLPYVIRLAGEYVSEIYTFIYNHKEMIPSHFITSFVSQNLAFIYLNIQRSISYWICNYRNQIRTYKQIPSYQFLVWLLRDCE